MGKAGLPKSTPEHDEPSPAPVTPEATEWRQRTLRSVLTVSLVFGGIATHEMIEELRQLHPECRVLLCTGYVEEELIRRRIQAGAYAHVAKPVSTDELLKRISALLAEGQRPDPEIR